MPEPSLQNLLDVAMDAAYLGGKRTLAYFDAGVEVETKSDNTPVTRADREAEQIIREVVAKSFPDHSVLGEESGELKGNPKYRWIIDPIDGTKSFIHGVPLYGTLIGVEVAGKPSVGIIYLPAQDHMISAAVGLGCRWNGRVAEVSSVKKLEDATLLTSSVTSAMKRSDAFDRLASRAKLVRNWGDCFGYALLATGRADVMVDPALNLWDAAALLPIMQEAGGHFFNWNGDPTIHGPDGAATNAALHAEVMEILRTEKRR